MKGNKTASERLNAKTLDAGKEDEEIRSKYGLATLRQARLARVTHEAWDQDVTLTQDYQALYRKYKEDPGYKDRLDEILALNSADRVVSKGGATN